jgi:capsid protein
MAGLDEWKIDSWARNVHHTAQQMTMKLMGTTREESAAPGKRIGFDRLAPMRGERGRPSRYAPTPNVASDETRRWANPIPWRFGKLVDNWDKLETLHTPESEYAIAGGADLNRFCDELILGTVFPYTAMTDLVGGVLGTAQQGEDTLTTVAYDTSNQLVAVGSTGLTKIKILAALTIFGNADYDPAIHGPLTCVYSPKAMEYLSSDTTLTSWEFTGVAGLRENKPAPGLLGIDRWVQSTRLPKVSNTRRCVIYAKNGVGLGKWLDEKRRLTERDDLSYTPQVYMESSWGAVRIDDKLVVAIDIDESAAIS